jgi:hypothetical protein
MNNNQINIIKSIKAEKLISTQWLFDKIIEVLFPLILVIGLPIVTGIGFYHNLTNNNPIVLSLMFFVLSISIACFLIYSIKNLNSLKRLNGVSRCQNSAIIKKIAKKNNWNIYSSNQQMTLINFSWKDTGTDWGKQITILYDGTDILINCISFGLYSSPSPFHLFANRRKVNKLKKEFESEIKTHYNTVYN